MVLLSALLHAVWNALAKDTERPMIFLAWLAIATALIGGLVLPFAPLAMVPDSVWQLLPVTVAVHVVYQVFLALAYERGELSVVYPISRSTPALVALIAVPFLDDPVSALGGLGIAVVMIGMWMVQTEGRLHWRAFVQPGTGYAYLTLLATAGYSLFDKRAMALFSEGAWAGPVPRAVVYFFLLSIGQTIFFVIFVFFRESREGWGRTLRKGSWRLSVGVVFSVVSYGLILEALRSASVSYVTAVRQTSVLFAMALSLVMLRERPGRVRLLGGLATVIGVVLIGI